MGKKEKNSVQWKGPKYSSNTVARTMITASNLVPRVLSYPPYGAREKDPGKRWSRVSQNLGDYKQTTWGRGG